MIKTFEDIQSVLSGRMDDLRAEYPIASMRVFGSYARGEQKKSSDVDILVEFIRPIGLLKFIRLENELRRLLGVKVDLVTKDALKPRIGKRILKEAVGI
ncbi:MAG: nucleotidyltransferase family protein [Nitrospirae bacterium]|nr:nucleotidyltransferase family protein [Nitrospirota bacterium]